MFNPNKNKILEHMKILMIYSSSFSYDTALKSLKTVPDLKEKRSFENVQLAFIQMEEHDELKPPLKKASNFIKWLSRKHPFEHIILHSFSHLSESKASADFSQNFLDEMEERLKLSGFEVSQTPYGYFLDLNIQAPGFSFARVFKSF